MALGGTFWKRMRRIVFRVSLVLLAAWLGLSVLAALFYPHLLYHPDRHLAFGSPANFGASYEEFRLIADDGVVVSGWQIPADPANEIGITPLVFHGNAGDVSTAVPVCKCITPSERMFLSSITMALAGAAASRRRGICIWMRMPFGGM